MSLLIRLLVWFLFLAFAGPAPATAERLFANAQLVFMARDGSPVTIGSDPPGYSMGVRIVPDDGRFRIQVGKAQNARKQFDWVDARVEIGARNHKLTKSVATIRAGGCAVLDFALLRDPAYPGLPLVLAMIGPNARFDDRVPTDRTLTIYRLARFRLDTAGKSRFGFISHKVLGVTSDVCSVEDALRQATAFGTGSIPASRVATGSKGTKPTPFGRLAWAELVRFDRGGDELVLRWEAHRARFKIMLWDYIYERSSGHNNFRVLVQLPKGDIDAGAWSLIPLTSESGRGQEQESLSRSWHSGCWTSDFRVLLDDSPGWSPLVVVEAHRDTGRSPTAAAPVTFTIYRLRHQPGRTSGTPQYQFLRQAAFRSKSVYCDLGEAFRAELAIERAEP